MTEADKQFYTVNEVAQLLRVSPSTIRNYIKKNIIGAVRIGVGQRTMLRIPQAEITKITTIDEPQDDAQNSGEAES